MARPPRYLPESIKRKIFKTGQTRGADDDVIYQNRVGRNSTVLIPLDYYDLISQTRMTFENGYIVLIDPEFYFTNPLRNEFLQQRNIVLGVNAVVFYQKRSDWLAYPPLENWSPAESRSNPLGGQFVARVAGTTAYENGSRVNLGFTSTRMKGAGIRVYEYASLEMLTATRIQLEALIWLCQDSIEAMVTNGIDRELAILSRNASLNLATNQGLLDYNQLRLARIVDEEGYTVCPLCLERLSAHGFMTRVAQAEGRQVHDLTITELNLFHIAELRLGQFNHRIYNLGWGHHHCNVVVKDAGIFETLEWMRAIINRNN